jgi:hypothetical protein
MLFANADTGTWTLFDMMPDGSVSLAAFAGAGGLATPCRFSAQSQSGTPEAEGWAYQFIRLA